MNRAEFSKRHVDPDRLRVLRVIIARLVIGAIRIRLARAGSGVLIVSPAEATTRTSSPAMAILSPGFATVCFALAYSPG